MNTSSPSPLRWVKRLIIAIFVLVLLIPIAGYIALQMVGLDEFKPKITELVKQQTGRELLINGDIGIGFSLSPSVVVNDVTFSNASWGSKPHMVTLKEAMVKIDLLPLMKKEIHISEIVLKNADIIAEVAKGGKNNWTFTPEKPAKDEEKTDKTKDETSEGDDAGSSMTPEIGLITIQNVKVRYKDATSGKDINVVLPSLSFTPKGTINIAATIAAGDVNADVKISAASLDALKEGTANVSVTAKGKAGERITATGKLNQFVTKQTFDFAVDAKGNTLKSFSALAGSPMPSVPAFDVKTNISGTPKKLILKNIQATVDGTNISGDATVNLAQKKPRITANLVIPTVNAKSKNGKKASPAPAASGATDGAATDAGAGDTAPAKKAGAAISLSPLNSVNADITLKINKVITDQATLDNLSTKAVINNGVLKASPLKFSTLGTGVSLNITANGASKTPRVSVSGNTSGLVLGKLLKTMGTTDRLINGATDVSFNLNTSGNNSNAMMSALGGTITAKMNKATYNSPSGMIKAADFYNMLAGKSNKGTIPVACFATKLNIKNGVATTDYMAVDAAGALVEAEGSINLAKQTVNMTLYPRSKSIGLADLSVPMKVSGKFSNISVIPDPVGTIATAGKVALALTGVPGIAVLAGKSLADKFGFTSKSNPCFKAQEPAEGDKKDLKESLKAKEDELKAKAKDVEKNVRAIRDDAKKNAKDLKKNLKNLKNIKNLDDITGNTDDLKKNLEGLKNLF